MEQLQGLDSLFIHHETANAPLHVLAVMDVSRKDSRHPISADTFRKLISARIAQFPGLCKKLVDPPIPLAPPLWVRVKPDLRIHIKETTLETQTFNEYLAELEAKSLNRNRPLWEFHIVHEKNEESHLIAKAHHALLDGIAGFELMANVFDLTEDGADEDLAKNVTDIEIEDEIPDWTTHVGAHLLVQPITWAQSSIKVARNVLNFAKDTLDSDEKNKVALPWVAPSWPEHRTLSNKRAVSQVSLDKDIIKSVRRNHSISFHDVLGVITAGALRKILIERDELPETPLICVSPVSLRRKRSMHGNELSVIFAPIPTHLEDVGERIEFVKESFTQAKDFLESLGADTLRELSRLAPWSALGTLWNMYSDAGLADKHAPFANLMLSSLPGPSFPMYCAGIKVDTAYPYGPIFDGSFLNITAISYLDKVNCGIVSSPESFNSVDALSREMLKACAELT